MKEITGQRYPLIKDSKTSKGLITITNYFGNNKIRLQITASKEDWKLLWSLWEKGNDDSITNLVGADFVTSFMSPLSKKLFDDKRIDRWNFIFDMKVLSAILYDFFSYCFKINQLSEYIEKIGNDELLKKGGKPDSLSYTAYCIQSIFHSLVEKYKLKEFEGSESFYITYILEGRKLIDADNKIFTEFFICLPLIGMNQIKAIIPQNEYAAKLLIDMREAVFYPKIPKERINNTIESIHNIFKKLFPFFENRESIIGAFRKNHPGLDRDGNIRYL